MEPINIMDSYGYMFIGIIVAIPNMIFFIRLIRITKFRSSFGVMLYGTLTGFGCGLVMTANGISRIIKYQKAYLAQKVPSTTCIYESLAAWENWVNFQYASCLFAHSVDRLIVVCNPPFYFAHQFVIVTLLVVLSFLPATLAILTLIIRELRLQPRIISRICKSSQIFKPPASVYVDLAKLGIGTSSVFLMLLMLFILHRKRERMLAFRKSVTVKGGKKADGYSEKQKSFTRVACSANLCNLFLFVLPGFFMFILETQDVTPTEQVHIAVKVAYLLNTLNIVISTMVFHGEIRSHILPKKKSASVSSVEKLIQQQSTKTPTIA